MLEKLQKDVKILKLLFVGISFVFLMLPFIAFTPQRNQEDIIKAKGIVIVDNNGNERILIGAPIPDAKDRIRTDIEKARKAWGKNYPNFDWYKNLNHDTNGILILDENGHDKIAIGDPIPDPNVGVRIAPGTGIQINDGEGHERAGWGYMPDIDQVGLGLDTKTGEGVVLVIRENGTNGLFINTKDERLFIGHVAPNEPGMELPEDFLGYLVLDKTGVKHKVSAKETTK